MPFVKLDTGILESTLWIDRSVRDVFITSLLMAEPYHAVQPEITYEIDSLDPTPFVVPVGWYGFVAAAGQGIIRRALVEYQEGMDALKKLASPDPESRSPEFDGRRMVRISGGFLILNYVKYREKDHGAAERMRLYRLRQKGALRRNSDEPLPSVTYADADAYAYEETTTPPTPSFSKKGKKRKIGCSIPDDFSVTEAHRLWAKSHPSVPAPDSQIERFRNHYQANGKAMKDWDAAFRNWLSSPFQQNVTGQKKPPPIPHRSAYEKLQEQK